MARRRTIGFTIDGLRDLNRDVDKLSGNELQHAIMDAMRGPGGKAFVKTMRGMIRSRSGMTKRYTQVWDNGGYKDDLEMGYKGPLSHGNKGGGRFQVGAWLESGTRPHEIYAKRGKHGLFVGGSFVSHVDHPGTKPQRIAKKTIEMHEGRMLYQVSRQIDALLKRKAAG